MSNPSSPASPSSDSDTESVVPECRVCGKSGGAPLCRFYPASLYGEAFVGNDETDCLHFACGSSTTTTNNNWALLSVAQVKKTYGQGKAAKLALTKTRTAAGPRKFGNITEVVLVKEFVANLVAAGGSATPKASKKKTPAKGKGSFMKKKMTLAQMRRFL